LHIEGDDMTIDHERLMAIAIEEAKAGEAGGDQPFGAVVAIDGQVVVRARSLKVTQVDVTAHSETLAIKRASIRLGRREFPEAVFYATCEPCPMCLGAILNAHIGTLVVGARHTQLPNYQKLNYNRYSVENFAELTGWKLKVIEGVLNDQCVALYRNPAVPLSR
jgi:tRNA(adenine34) deaminase